LKEAAMKQANNVQMSDDIQTKFMSNLGCCPCS